LCITRSQRISERDEQRRGDATENVVLDLRNLTFVSSLAVGEMMSLHKSKKEAGGRVVVADPNGFGAGVLKAARVTATFFTDNRQSNR